MSATTVRAPAKLILMGEHAVVYQRPALVAALGLWLHATVSSRSTAGVGIHLAEWEHHEETSWTAIQTYADTVRRRWHAYNKTPTAEAFAHMRGSDPAHLVKVALGEAARHAPALAKTPLDLTVESSQPVGAGFGSSAAVGVAVAKACLTHHNADLPDDTLFDIALDIERRQHGTPSGVDPATILRGGLVWAESDGDALQWHSVHARAPVLENVRIYHTGSPNESTGTVVDAVRARRADDPAAFTEVLDRIETTTRRLRDTLATPDVSSDTLLTLLREGEACLEALGVVPPPVRQCIRTIERRGGAAKISGAGALTGSGAGSLIVYHPDPDTPMWHHLRHLSEFNVPLCVEGAHPIETPYVHG